jgi:hypothetical protein
LHSPVRKTLFLVFAIALILLLVLSILLSRYGFDEKGALNIELFRALLDGYKAIGIGFLVAILAVLIPQLLPEEKYRFERLRDSREAYSQAQTGILYLPQRMADLSYMEAIVLLQSAHEYLHVAQTYGELAQHLAPHDDPETWGQSRYRTLTAVKDVMERNVQSWDALSRKERLHDVLSAIQLAKQKD